MSSKAASRDFVERVAPDPAIGQFHKKEKGFSIKSFRSLIWAKDATERDLVLLAMMTILRSTFSFTPKLFAIWCLRQD